MHRQPSALDPAFGNWLAGFIDGEGYFAIGVNQGACFCSFRIDIRLDDRAILEEIRERTGLGTIRVRQPSPNDSKNRCLQAVWQVHRADACLRLAHILDAHPLRAKKARDYAIWREAVFDWQTPRRYGPGANNDWTRMLELASALKAVRRFETAGLPIEVPERIEQQLTLEAA
jgi:hypothetical protein